jgi:hypothetical protein
MPKSFFHTPASLSAFTSMTWKPSGDTELTRSVAVPTIAGAILTFGGKQAHFFAAGIRYIEAAVIQQLDVAHPEELGR